MKITGKHGHKASCWRRQQYQSASHHQLSRCAVFLVVFLVCKPSSGAYSWSVVAATTDDNGASPFRFGNPSAGLDLFSGTTFDVPPRSPPSSARRSNPLVWQPLPLRATFRPLNRGPIRGQQQPPSPPSPTPPTPPTPPTAPQPPSPPSLPESLALTYENLASSGGVFESQPSQPSFPPPSRRSSLTSASGFGGNSFISPSITPSTPPSTSTTSTTTTTPQTTTAATTATAATTITTPRPLDATEDDEAPTRQPLSRFRPTRAPSDEEDFNSGPTGGAFGLGTNSNNSTSSNSISGQPTIFGLSSSSMSNSLAINSDYRITNDCYECICEASTNCNVQSRCQTSDVRHTRCGMFLISYDQWLASGLSRDLVSREALARDAAADERAFYDCVTRRDCSERLLAIYLEKNNKDCDKDGRIDCYDLAAIHHSGLDQCSSESLLDSQYWSDFNACFGFGRRR